MRPAAPPARSCSWTGSTRAPAPAALSGHGSGLPSPDIFHDRVIPDVVPADLVRSALDPGAVKEFGDFGIGVVLDALGFAISIFIHALALLPHARQSILAAERRSLLEAVLVLGDP